MVWFVLQELIGYCCRSPYVMLMAEQLLIGCFVLYYMMRQPVRLWQGRLPPE